MPPGARGAASFSDHPSEPRVRRRARDPAALGHRLATDLLDVRCEGDGWRGADRHADPIRMDGALGGLELADARCIEAAGDEDADVFEAREVETSTDLLDEVHRHAAALSGCVEAHPAQALAQGLGHAERLFGLVLEGVD